MLEEVEMPRPCAAWLRHSFMTVSCVGQSALAQSGHGKRPPVLKSISMSSRFSPASNFAARTIHGGTSPSASWNRSVSRMCGSSSPVEPRSCHRARGRQGVAWRHPARVEACVPANLDRHFTRRPAGAAGRDEGMVSSRTKRSTGSPRIMPATQGSPTQFSEEAEKLPFRRSGIHKRQCTSSRGGESHATPISANLI